MSIKVGTQSLPATLQRSLGYKPAEKDVTVAFIHGAKLGLTANIRDFNIADSPRLAQQLGEHIEKQQPTELLYVGWGPQGNDNAMALLSDIAQDHTSPEHTALHVNNNQVRVMTIGVHEQWQPPLELTEPPMALIMELPAPHSNRDGFQNAYVPLDTPQFGRPDITTEQTYGDLSPSVRAEIADRQITHLASSAPDDTATRQASLAHLITSDAAIRDHVIIGALQNSAHAEVLIQLYKSAPTELQGPLGTMAAVGAFKSPGGNVAATTLLEQAEQAPGGLGNCERLHALLSQFTKAQIDPKLALDGLAKLDQQAELTTADKTWHAARAPKQKQPGSRLPGLNAPINLAHKTSGVTKNKPPQPPIHTGRKPTL